MLGINYLNDSTVFQIILFLFKLLRAQVYNYRQLKYFRIMKVNIYIWFEVTKPFLKIKYKYREYQRED